MYGHDHGYDHDRDFGGRRGDNYGHGCSYS